MKFPTLALSAFLACSCASTLAEPPPWEAKAPDLAGYRRVSMESMAEMIRHAEADFRASPAYPDHGPIPISAIGAARRPDGMTVIAFSLAATDVNAVYIFNSEGQIVDRYLHSYWG